MASTKSRACGPTHPSAAFLIKCAKEKEKLQYTLQKQLQEHMLHMLENNVFPDILISESGKVICNENIVPQFFQVHKAVVKVRTPAFYDHLLKNEETGHGVTSYNACLEYSELQHFLRKIYTDDDIRKHECEALRLTRIYSSLLQNRGPINKYISEVDEFEKESVNSSCTDNFVTPKTSPVTPEKSLDVSDMFKSAQNKSVNNGNYDASEASIKARKHSKGNVSSESTTEHSSSYSRHSNAVSEESNIAKSLADSIELSNKPIEESFDIEYDDNLSQEEDPSSNSNDEDESDAYESSNVGSMVRSNTFDLQTQGSLEEALEEALEWCTKELPHDDYKTEDSVDYKTDSLSRKSECAGFYLHDHTPSPKSNIFKQGFSRENSTNHEIDASANGFHFRRLDGSMSDSGFMSHSTFSMLSDGGLNNSISSSFIMPSDGTPSPSVSVGNTAYVTDTKPVDADKQKRNSGTMFPLFIDINNLPSDLPETRREKKSGPYPTYMYIDATNLPPKKNERNYVNSYAEFFSDLEADVEHKKAEILFKTQSTPHLDLCKGSFEDLKTSKYSKKVRPQSCYMYIDLDSVKDEEAESRNSSAMKRAPSSVSMYVDLNDVNQNISLSDSEQFSNHKENNSYYELKNENSVKMFQSVEFKSGDVQKRKLSDSFLSGNIQDTFNGNRKQMSLPRNRQSHSASAIDYRSLTSSDFHPVKYKTVQRYSDGVYYDNIHEAKLSNNANSYKGKIWDDSKPMLDKDIKMFNQTVKLLQSFNKNEPSGSCSNLGKFNTAEKLITEDKVKWKSTGDMGKSKESDTTMEGGLLPMSPILRRKTQQKDIPKSSPPPVVVKASTKPQDIDAMTFPLNQDSPRLSRKVIQVDGNCESPSRSSSQKKLDTVEDSKSSSESLKGSEGASESSDPKEKIADCMSRSGSSLMTMSGGDTSSSDKYVVHEVAKDRFSHLSINCDREDDSETIYSEVSDISSSIGGLASLERRWRECHSIEGEPTQKFDSARCILEACSKLGEDLLRMFLEEVDTDITIEVEEKQIKAHRCILSSRCKYFEGLLKNSNTGKNTSTISLEGFSYQAVHFALCHIYSGAMNIPKDCNISELALLADMLNLETLIDVIVLHLKSHYCHFFHRPCAHCIQGVIECLPLSMVCGLNDLRDKCITWIGKYFTRTWPNKSFAALSDEIRELCYEATSHNLSVDTVIDMTLNCDRLITTLPQMKWTEPIFGMVSKLLQDCIHFMAQNFSQILSSEGFLALGKGQSWNITALEEDIISSVELITPDIACKSYVKVNQILSVVECEETGFGEFTQNFVDLLHKINRHCERHLIQNANKVVHCQSWACLSPQVQKRIKDAAVIVFEFEKPTAPPPRLSSLHRKLQKQNDGDDVGCLERSTYPKKGRGAPNRKFIHDPNLSPKIEPNCKPENYEKINQRREIENIIKKVVSPIKEEVQTTSIDHSDKEASYDKFSGVVNPCSSSVKSYVSHKGYIDAHEEDSLRDLQELPRDQTQSPTQNMSSSELLVCGISIMELDESHSPAHCSDNPDSLEVNEEISSDSKDDVSAFAEDGSGIEKGSFESPEICDKNRTDFKNEEEKSESNYVSSSPFPKNHCSIPVRDNKVPLSSPYLSHANESQAQSQVSCDKSPIKKLANKSLVPLPTGHNIEEKKSPDSRGKDLVAEIDADSRMVSHCLQEAEMLEQQLSRKLQRQHQDGTSNISQYIHKSPTKVVPSEHKIMRPAGTRLQKASSTSQIKNLTNALVRTRSPGRTSKYGGASPSTGHAPRILKTDSGKEAKSRKTSQSPKGNFTTNPRSFRSMESIASVQRQLSLSTPQAPKRTSSKVNRTRPVNSTTRALDSGSK